MKTTFLFILLSISFLSNAQNWCPPGAVWYYSNGNVGSTGSDYLVYEKDTVISGQPCQKITALTTKYGPVEREPDIFTYSSNDTVFFYYGGNFWPVYYFNASIGDTISLYIEANEFSACDTFLRMVIDSTTTIVFQGDSLRYYRATQTPRPAFPAGYAKIEVVDKFGALENYLLPTFYCTGLVDYFIYYLSCYQDSTFARFQLRPNLECNPLYYTAVSDLNSKVSLTLHPNPANTQLNITIAGTTITQYQVLNYSGKEVMANIATGDAIQIEVSTLPQGIYLVKLELGNGQYAVRRFIKN